MTSTPLKSVAVANFTADPIYLTPLWLSAIGSGSGSGSGSSSSDGLMYTQGAAPVKVAPGTIYTFTDIVKQSLSMQKFATSILLLGASYFSGSPLVDAKGVIKRALPSNIATIGLSGSASSVVVLPGSNPQLDTVFVPEGDAWGPSGLQIEKTCATDSSCAATLALSVVAASTPGATAALAAVAGSRFSVPTSSYSRWPAMSGSVHPRHTSHAIAAAFSASDF